MKHKDRNIIGQIVIPSLNNLEIERAYLSLKNGENPVIEFLFDTYDEPPKIPIIIGTFTGVGKVTFLDCYNIAGNIGASGNTVKYSTASYIRGYHFYSEEELEFDKFNIEIPNLVGWLNIRTVINENINNETHYILRRADELEFHINENMLLKIEPASNWSWNNYKTTLQETVLLKIESVNERIKLSEFYKVLRHLIKFFVFIQTNDPVIESITLRNKELVEHVGGKEHTPHLELFLSPIKLSKLSSVYNVYLDYKDISEHFEEVLQKWFNHEITSQIELLLTKTFVPNLNIENHFLNVCFGIESFHRKFINNRNFTEEEFSERIEYVKTNIPDKTYQKWITEKLQFANEPSFRQRLKSFNDQFSLFVENPSHLIGRIVETRNYFVHRSKMSKKVLSNAELIYVTRYVEIILKTKLLEYLGLTIDKYEKKVKYAKESIDHLKLVNNIKI